jgi:hypothetical protein
MLVTESDTAPSIRGLLLRALLLFVLLLLLRPFRLLWAADGVR